jgi:ATP-utilizing enzymes of the PP-loop superfamily
MPCLTFPVRHAPFKKELSRVEKGEIFLKKHIPGDLRLRNHGEIARLEIGAGAMEKVLAERARIAAFLKRLGWRYITLDIEGYRMGSMNKRRRS